MNVRGGIVALLSVVLFDLLIGCPPAQAETYVGGPVQGAWTAAGNPYITTDSLIVESGTSLVIEPGVEIQFAARHALIVHGLLSATGAPGDSIRMSRRNVDEPWCGVRFFGAAEGCALRFCVITNTLVDGEASMDVSNGGGVYAEETELEITDCRFHDCRTEGYTGFQWWSGGGGVFMNGGSATIRDCRFTDCRGFASCTSGGGAIGAWNAELDVESCHITGCSAHGVGGGIGAGSSRVRIAHCIIMDCSGFHYGGAVGLRYGPWAQITDCLIAHNEAPDLYGGGISLREADSTTISYCTIAHNHVGPMPGYGSGGGLAVNGTGTELPIVTGCVFWGNTAMDQGPQIYPSYLPAVSYCDVEGDYVGDGNFDADPLFTQAGAGGERAYFLSCIDAGQSYDSPCIDAGPCSALEAGLADRTTRTDELPDEDTVDLGFHYPTLAQSVAELDPRTHPWMLSCQPNPMRGAAMIELQGPATGVDRPILRILDPTGRVQRRLAPATGADGRWQYRWDGRDGAGRRVAPGLYFVAPSADRIRAHQGGRVLVLE